MTRLAMRFARWLDVEAFFLLRNSGWRGRLGLRLEALASRMACWAWREGAR